MKKIVTIIIGLFLMSATLVSQTSQGIIELEVTDIQSDNPQAEMMKGTQTFIHFKGKESMTKVNMMGGMVKVDAKQDAEENLDMLIDAMGSKIWVSSTKLERARLEVESESPLSEMDIEYDKEDTKTVAGFECYKMTVTFPDMEDASLVAYITEDIEVRPSFVQGVDFEDFDGMPLEAVVTMAGNVITTTTKSFETEVDDAIFELNTSGFQKMSLEEYTEMLKQFGM